MYRKLSNVYGVRTSSYNVAISLYGPFVDFSSSLAIRRAFSAGFLSVELIAAANRTVALGFCLKPYPVRLARSSPLLVIFDLVATDLVF